jgi:ferrous iron transport protein B
LYYPHDSQRIDDLFAPQIAAMAEQRSAIEHLPDDAPERIKVAEAQRELDNEIVGEYRRNSYLGRAGHAIEPVVRPLGWDWRIGCAAIASFPAREVIVATLGIIYNLGEEVDTENEEDRGHLVAALQNARWTDTGERVFNLPVALSIMVFFALCAQCASTLVIIKRETNSWAWPTFTFVYMTTLAYLGALVTYQVGRLFL